MFFKDMKAQVPQRERRVKLILPRSNTPLGKRDRYGAGMLVEKFQWNLFI